MTEPRTTPLNVTIEGVYQLLDFDPCPFCSSQHLQVTNWWDDDGEYDAIGCLDCKAEAPATSWNRRAKQ
jgi:hypothetical protein